MQLLVLEREKAHLIHNNVNVSSTMRRSPRGRPRFVPLSALQAKNSINNDSTTEMETAVNSKYSFKPDIKPFFNTVRKQQHQRDSTSYDDKNQQQAQQQHLKTDELEQQHFIDNHPFKQTFSNDRDNDENLRKHQQKQQELLSEQNFQKPQQKQKLRENKIDHDKTQPDNCCTVIYERPGSLMNDESGECFEEQQHKNTQPRFISDIQDGELEKQKTKTIIERPVEDCNIVDEELLESGPKQRILNYVRDLPRISNHKIVLFGGIDPYCLQCHHGQQPQQDKTTQNEQMHPHNFYHHNQQQELKQRKRVHSIDKIILNTVNRSHSQRTHRMQTHACVHIQTHNTTAAGDICFENFGDQVLYYDIDAMEWRHLSHIPFGSRHHHSVVACNGLIYVIGGTRTGLCCSKKSVFEKSIWCFNPVTVKWTLETNLPESRRDFAVIAIDNKNKYRDKVTKHDIGFYVIGGEGVDGRVLSTVWFYNLKRKTWVKKPSLNMGRYGLAAAIVNNEIWVAGGIINDNTHHGESLNATTANVITDTIEIYNLKYTDCDVLANTQTKEYTNTKCLDVAGYSTRGEFGGCNTSKNSYNVNYMKNKLRDAVDNRNSIEGQWVKSKVHLRVPRLFSKLCKMSNGQLYVVGGITFNNELKQLTSPTEIDVLNENQKKWEHVGDLNFARHGHDVATLNDHCFAVIGGVSIFEQRTLSKVEAFCTKTRKSLMNLPDLPWPLSGCAAVTIK